ncbi:glycosyltransferase family 4 protein [Burkholderia stagnalis]|uniref:glycosyltransferase family 4 protein n=2 Tax=Burkholderia stagnalis TaxID=1503054 RepID=UPI0009C05780|nr:glycosyltransferase family 4 protein [Burkholderia stagnalis]
MRSPARFVTPIRSTRGKVCVPPPLLIPALPTINDLSLDLEALLPMLSFTGSRDSRSAVSSVLVPAPYTNNQKRETQMTAHADRNLRVLHVGPGNARDVGVAAILSNLQAKAEQLRAHRIEAAFFGTRDCASPASVVLFPTIDFPRFALRALQADLVLFHVTSPGSLMRKAALFAIARLLRRRCILHVHSGECFARYRTAGRLYRAAVDFLVSHADARVVASDAVRHDMIACVGAGAQSTVIGDHAGAFERNLLPDADRAADGRYVLFSASLVEHQGLTELLHAICMLRQRGLAVPLKVAGGGNAAPWRSLAESLGIGRQVEFVGSLQGDAKYDAYRNATILCMPNYFETCGLSALEAMWAGRPVIGTSAGRPPDLVDDGATGYLIPPRNIPLLAQRIEALWSDTSHADTPGDAGFETARRRFDSAAAVSRYTEVYACICNSPALTC